MSLKITKYKNKVPKYYSILLKKEDLKNDFMNQHSRHLLLRSQQCK